MFGLDQLPTSVLQAGAIFLSIMIEALPFVLIGALISGFIDVFITPEKSINSFPRTSFLPFYLEPLSASFFRLANVVLSLLSIGY